MSKGWIAYHQRSYKKQCDVRQDRLKAIRQWKNWMVPSNEVARLVYQKKYGKEIEPNEIMLVVNTGGWCL